MVLGHCGDDPAPSAFNVTDAGVDASDAPLLDPADVRADVDPTLGGPCLDDRQCDDGAACTADRCDPALGRCRFEPDHTQCADDVYCDGVEVCEPSRGCVEGEPVSCSDDQTCTIDTCVEADRSCRHTERDADGDGDPVWNCGDGGDCNDLEPSVSSLRAEVCDNGRDDDCDQEADETDCVRPQHDRCDDALEVTAEGRFVLSLAAAQGDYSVSCVEEPERYREVVVEVVVPDTGAPHDVELRARVASGELALAAPTACGSAEPERSCAPGAEADAGGGIARLRLRSVPAGRYPIYVLAAQAEEVVLDVRYEAPSTSPSNETCGTALPLSPESHLLVQLVDAATDLATACEAATGDLVYQFELTEPQDVTVYAASLDGWGRPVLSLRGAGCSSPGDEITCRAADDSALFAPRLAAGRYYLGVAASAPTDLDLVVQLSPPSAAPDDESCEGAPSLRLGERRSVELEGHADDLQLGCLAGAVDAAYAVELAERADVLLLARLTSGDTGAVSVARLPCGGASDGLSCSTGDVSPLRATARGLAAGTYYAVVETAAATPVQLSAFVRPTTPPTLVPFADDCASAVLIDEQGGLFQGNTSQLGADYEAGCDSSTGIPGGAPDQMLRLVLTEKRRVIFDMSGSDYPTLLNVRRGPSCPGAELYGGCAAGYVAGRSFVELVLDPGEYHVQVDGYAGAVGAWRLNVFTSPP